ncbi:hypothetical protein PM082_011392 [Marasmius tenuissimus]|nr:hypothetical protein PM082_011392 [Marasmius tenuissimus]
METGALQITFPSPPTAGTTAAFEWTREAKDFEDAWLRKQILEDHGISGLSEPSQAHFGNKSLGNANLDFNRAGSFLIYVYDQPGLESAIVNPEEIGEWTTITMKVLDLTELKNLTSLGATLPMLTVFVTPPSASTTSPTSSNILSPKPNIPLIVGLSIAGTALLSVGVITVIILFRRRFQQSWGGTIGIGSNGDPALLTPYPPLGELLVAEGQLRGKEDNQPHDIKETRAPNMEEQRRERRIVRHKDSGVMLLAASTNQQSWIRVAHFPLSYSEVNFIH